MECWNPFEVDHAHESEHLKKEQAEQHIPPQWQIKYINHPDNINAFMN